MTFPYHRLARLSQSAIIATAKSSLIFLGLVAVAASSSRLTADEPTVSSEPNVSPRAESAYRVVTTVADEPIYEYEIERELKRALGDRKIDPKSNAALRSAALRKLVDQRLIVQSMRDRQRLVSEAQFKRAWNRMLEEMKAKGLTLASYLSTSQRLEAELEQAVWWEVSWESVIENYRTDANLEKYFERHARDFDGTRLRVAQILFKLPESADADTVTSTRDYAQSIRRKIVDKKLRFADAAKQYSQAPSAAKGGEIGWIERHRPMPAAFSDAAYLLAEGQVSEPVVTSLGIHLISVLEVEAGSKEWRDSRLELQQAVDRYLFRWIADLQRPHATIKPTPSDR